MFVQMSDICVTEDPSGVMLLLCFMVCILQEIVIVQDSSGSVLIPDWQLSNSFVSSVLEGVWCPGSKVSKINILQNCYKNS